MSLREQIASQTRALKPLDAQGWPEGVYVKELSGAEVDEYQKQLFNDDETKKVLVDQTVVWIAACLADQDGNRIYDPRNEDDLKELLELPYKALESAGNEVLKVNGLLDDPSEAKKN